MSYSLAHIRKGLNTILPGGVRTASANQRTLTSFYFPPQDPQTKSKSKLMTAETAPIRAVATVVVLGDRRPYQIEIKVSVERRSRDDAAYYHVSYDSRLARLFARDLQDYLVKSQENRDLIDDFRPF